MRYDFGESSIVRCTGCRLLYLHPRPDSKQTFSVYGAGYFQSENFLEGDHATIFGYADYVAAALTMTAMIATMLPSHGATW